MELAEYKILEDLHTVELILNQFTFDQKLVRRINVLLDEIEKLDFPFTLVTKSSNPKIWSAGLNFKVFK